MWKDHLEHLKEVFKAFQEADLKIKQSLVGADGVELLPEKAFSKASSPW